MTQHTPGPWLLVPNENPIRVLDADHGVVCEMSGPWGNIYAEPNARLIVAAPDLLAACERALGLLELHGSGKLAQTPAGDDLRAAIAKARETP